MRQVVIGKQGNQPFPINDPNVSRIHATLYIDEMTGTLTLVDSSTNGTFIYNGTQFVRIPPHQKVNVRPDTMIRLGPETRFHISRLLVQNGYHGHSGGHGGPKGPIEEKKPPKKVDISHLHEISEEYKRRKLELEGKLNTLNGMRSFTIVASVMASAGGGFLGSALGLDTVQSGILIGVLLVVLVTTLMIIINTSVRKVSAAREENEHNYAVKFCCPKCHYPFKGRYYENILASGCPNPKCKAEFNEGH